MNSTPTPKLQSMALIPLLGNWASSQDHSKQFIKQQINKKIKWRIHQSNNTRFTWKTPNPEKNHGRCHKTTREKYSLCGKLLQPLSEIIFSHPSPKYIILKNTLWQSKPVIPILRSQMLLQYNYMLKNFSLSQFLTKTWIPSLGFGLLLSMANISCLFSWAMPKLIATHFSSNDIPIYSQTITPKI